MTLSAVTASISSSLRAQLGRQRDLLEPGARAGLVDDVDRLVGQVAVGDVAVREARRGEDRLVRDADVVVRLVARLEPLDDLHRLVDRRRLHHDRLEAPLEGAVLLDVLAVLVERRRADALELAARERRLEHRGGVDRALGRAGADERVDLVDEDHDVRGLGDLLHDRLEPLLELAAVLGPRDQGAEVELHDALAEQRLGHLPGDDALGEPLGDRGLADARLADEHRVVLRAAREDLDDALDLVGPADHRVELGLLRELGQVAGELVEQRRLLLLLLGLGRGDLEQGDRLLAQHRQREAEALEHLGGDAGVLLDQAEQQVLGADVVLAEQARLLDRELEDLLGLGREGDLAEGQDVLRGRHARHEFGLELLLRELQGLEHRDGGPGPFADDAEQQVLGAEVLVLVLFGLAPREDDHPPGAFGEAFKHGGPFSL